MCSFHAPVRTKNRSNSAPLNGTSNTAVPNHGMTVGTNGIKPNEIKLVAQERRVIKILQMIQAQPLQRIENLAREFNLSHSHLEHLFKQQTGVSLGQLLTEQRMCRAAHLLANTNMRIKEIAHTVGYEHTSSFIRAFERHFMQAPRLYRQEPAASRTKG
ncbi:MAG: helix-turn-helix transcriptional regulator [Candidatus Angelobacter sp.]